MVLKRLFHSVGTCFSGSYENQQKVTAELQNHSLKRAECIEGLEALEQVAETSWRCPIPRRVHGWRI